MGSYLIQYGVLGLGGALGTMLRFGLGSWVDQRTQGLFPWGTVLVNCTGCLVIGFLATVTAVEGRYYLAPLTRQFILIGILGGYTTFSSFSLQTLTLVQEQEWLAAAGNVLLSVLGCLAAVWLGSSLAQGLNHLK